MHTLPTSILLSSTRQFSLTLSTLAYYHDPPSIILHVCSYRGYGQSSGSPSEAGLKQDADASLAYLLQRKDINPKKV